MQELNSHNDGADDEPEPQPDAGIDESETVTSADGDAPLEAPAYEAPSKPPLARRAAGWLATAAVVGLLVFGARAVGQHYYDPPSRLPAPVTYPLTTGLLGANGRVLSETRVAAGWFPEDDIELTLTGPVYEMSFPRTFGDRFLARRHETATVFTASTPVGGEHRFLVLRDDDAEPVLAIEAPASRSETESLEGLFLRLPPPDSDAPLSGVATAVAALLPDVDAAKARRVSSGDFTVFGPFGRGDAAALEQRIDANVVLSHLKLRLDAADADVSIAAPMFTVEAAPSRGTIRGTYAGRLRLIQEPMWEDSETATLGHELTHAFISRALADESTVLNNAADYMDAAHPRLFRDVVGDLYESLDRSSRAEEALAFVTGAIAAGQTKTVAAGRLLSNDGLATVSEPVLKSDVELLVRIGLLPDCMDPTAVGRPERELSFDYYRAARRVRRLG